MFTTNTSRAGQSHRYGSRTKMLQMLSKENKQKTKQHMHKKGSVLQKGCKTWHLTSQSDKNLTHLQEVHETNTQITP